MKSVIQSVRSCMPSGFLGYQTGFVHSSGEVDVEADVCSMFSHSKHSAFSGAESFWLRPLKAGRCLCPCQGSELDDFWCFFQAKPFCDSMNCLFQILWTRLTKMWILTCCSTAASESILSVLSTMWESAPSSLWFLDQKNVSINMYKLFLQTAASFGGLLQIAFQVFGVWIGVHFLSYLPHHVCTFRWVVSLVTSGRNYSWSLPTIRILFSTIHGM